ncbi:hypothetical protein PDPUS_1_02442 [Photobacterium damselae subsp. piscicida]|uniref:Uncharacterized protein n=1 Tax=Photobacterium damsela subsp. piscicida TaxID=38294 RepID=A0AAD1CHX2_PHODP|nr:hypothetical protein PDPUS_1_02442 [Photobacterium damselae subsp. piscicida]GAW43120.1 hypothetical protein PDPJ_1_00534 [Photobacterium damselae subsp. piscicida]
MFRLYALFSFRHPLLHKLNILLVLSIIAFSSYELVYQKNIFSMLGYLFVILCFIVFAKSAYYRTKYLGS